MATDPLGTEYVEIRLDSDGAEREARAAGERMASQINRGLDDAGQNLARNIQRQNRGGVDIPVRIDPRQAMREMRRSLQGVRPAQLPATLNTRNFQRQVQQAVRGMRPVAIPATLDVRGFEREAHNAVRGMRPIRVPATLDVDRDRAGLGAMPNLPNLPNLPDLPNTSGIAGLSGTSPAIAAISAALVQLTALVSPLLGALAAVPAVVSVATAAFGTLALALSGTGEAFGKALTGSQKEFEDSLSGLAPAAQSAAREVRALKPAFDSLKSSVQGAFFDQISGQITKTASALGGPLKSGLRGIATEWGKAASGVLDYFSSAQGVGAVDSILNGTREVVRGIGEGLKPVIAGFTNLAGTISKAFGKQAGDGLASMGKSFGDWLTQISKSGQAIEWVQKAKKTFTDLWTVGKQTIGIIADIIGALADGYDAGESGNPLESLGSILTDVRAGLQTTTPAIAAFAKILKTIWQAAAGGVGLLRGAFSGLGLGELSANLQEGIAGFDLTAWLADKLNSAITWIAALPSRIGAALAALPGIVAQFFTGIWSSAVATVSSAVTSITTWFAALPGRIMAVLATLPGILWSGFQTAVGAAFRAVGWGIGMIVNYFYVLPSRIAAALAGLGGRLWAWFTAAWNQGKAAVISGINSTIAWFRTLPGRAVAAVQSLGSRLAAFFSSAWTGAKSAVIAGVNATVGFFRPLPSRAMGVLRSLPGQIARLFSSMWGSVSGAVSGLINSIVGAFRGLPGRIMGAIGDIGSRVRAKISQGISDVVPGFANGGIITGPTLATLGEGGAPEVVLPLTKPARARKLAEKAGVPKLLGTAGDGRTSGGNRSSHTKTVTNHFTINQVGDAHHTADTVMRRLAYASAL